MVIMVLGSTRFCDAVREVEKGKCVCVCVCVFIWWYILDRQGKLIRKGKLV